MLGSDSDPSASGGPELVPDDGTYQPFRGAHLEPGDARLWRVSPTQYRRVLEAALGEPVEIEGFAFTKSEGFPNHDASPVDDVLFATLEEQVSALVDAHAPYLESRLTCDVGALDRACLGAFLDDLLPVVQRTHAYDRETYLALFDTLRAELSRAESLRAVVTAVLIAPKTLFRTELGPPDDPATGVVTLSADELAEALALTLWNGPPDAELLDRAADGLLLDDEVYRSEVERLLADPRGTVGMRELVLEWAGLTGLETMEKNTDLFPEFGPELRASMIAETSRFVDHVLTERDADFGALLTMQESFVDARLAELYGLDATTVDPDALTPLPSGERRGLFTQASVISAMSEPTLTGVVYRGKVLLRRLLCRELEPPPDIVIPNLDDITDETATTRDRLETLESMEPCGTCHRVLHPPAFAMESYDAIGRFRTTENGSAIDPSGALTGTQMTGEPFRDAPELFEHLAESPEVHQCFVRQAFRYVFGRREADGDDPTLRAAFASFRDRRDIRRLVEDIVLSPSFRQRTRSEP